MFILNNLSINEVIKISYVESSLCESSGLGKNMSLLSTIFSIYIYAKLHCCYLRYLIYILTEIKCPWQ